MENLIIQINWGHLGGIIGSLILIAWYANGRFTKIETDMTWLKDDIKSLKNDLKELANDLKVKNDNEKIKLMGNSSPIALLPPGEVILKESGLKDYIDQNKELFLEQCNKKDTSSAYEVQEYIFDFFDNFEFEKEIDTKLKNYAYEKGLNIETIRRIGAIYFRDICLKEYNLKTEDIDNHDN